MCCVLTVSRAGSQQIVCSAFILGGVSMSRGQCLSRRLHGCHHSYFTSAGNDAIGREVLRSLAALASAAQP